MRVRRSFAFTDLSGFTSLTETQGDERAVEVLVTFRSLLRDICSRRGVRIAKWLGDGAMLVCPSTPPLVGATLELHFAVAARSRRPTPLGIRSGVDVGDVILFEGDDYIGHPVNVAARLCDLATGGELLAAPGVLDHLPRWAVIHSGRDLTLRGLAHALPVAGLAIGAPGPGAIPDPVCGIPLTREVAEATSVDRLGRELWFCSDSCRDTWEHRPRPPDDELGSLRTPLLES